jgi:hypothetical protein
MNRFFSSRICYFVMLALPNHTVFGQATERAIDGSVTIPDYASAGVVCVELQDGPGTPSAGFALADSHELIGDEIGCIYDGKGIRDLSAYRGKPCRLRFQLGDADLFSYRFFA